MIGEGDKAPRLEIETSDGGRVDLESPGGPLVLYFYPKDRNGSECPQHAS